MRAAILIALLATGCANWTINGIPANRIFEAEPQEFVALAGGFASSFAVHWLAHVAYLELNGIEWEQRGTCEYLLEPTPEKHRQWMGRIGFLGQLAGGLAIKYSPWSDTFFATGYHLGSLTEIGSYPFIDKGQGDDLDLIGDTGMIEWAAYTAAAIWMADIR